MLKTMEGFLCSGPQLVLQLALWMRGTLTSPLQLVLADHMESVANQTSPSTETVNSLQVGGSQCIWKIILNIYFIHPDFRAGLH